MELITGATGYVGGALLERLLSEGRDVRALARDPSRLPPGAKGARGDLLTGEGLEAAMR
nr:NAD(P)H-binding protein [Thermoleophilaceae bacterium]